MVKQQNNNAAVNLESISSTQEKQEIQVLKYRALLRHSAISANSGLTIKVIKKYDELCANKSLSQKFAFINYSLQWLGKKLINKSKAVIEHAFRHDQAGDQQLKIAIICTGGVGDLVNGAAFLNKFYQTYHLPAADCYYQNPDNFRVIYAKANYVADVFHEDLLAFKRENYNIIITVRDHVTFELHLLESQLNKVKDLLNALAIANRKVKYLQHYVAHHPNLDGHFADEVVLKNFNRVTAPGLFANLNIDETKDLVIYPDLSSANKLLDQYQLAPLQFITIHDGFDNESDITSKTSTKQWDLAYWQEVVAALKQQYPQFKIVQLGAKNSRVISGVDLCLIGKTSLQEAINLLLHTRLHIDNESGLVRVATALGKQSIVLFGPTSADYYGLKQNFNIASSTCGNCFWSTFDWQSRCPRGLADPVCMASITPQQVISAADRILQ